MAADVLWLALTTDEVDIVRDRLHLDLGQNDEEFEVLDRVVARLDRQVLRGH